MKLLNQTEVYCKTVPLKVVTRFNTVLSFQNKCEEVVRKEWFLLAILQYFNEKLSVEATKDSLDPFPLRN